MMDSDPDDSVEAMKLDLIKAKCLHNKIKGNYQKTPITASKLKPARSRQEPRYSIESHKSTSISYSGEVNTTDDDNTFDEIDDINSYADFLIGKKKSLLNNSSNNNNNNNIQHDNDNYISTDSHHISSAARRYQMSDTSMNPGRNSSEGQAIINQSNDILAQWRLRRKLTTAQNEVEYEGDQHQHYLYQLQKNLQRETVKDPDIDNIHKPIMPTPKNNNRNEIPVRDNPIMLYKDSACQYDKEINCKSIGINTDVISTKSDDIKCHRSRKVKNAATNTMKDRKTSKEISIQTDFVQPTTTTQHQTLFNDSFQSNFDEDLNSCRSIDYIDRVIAKNLENPLVESRDNGIDSNGNQTNRPVRQNDKSYLPRPLTSPALSNVTSLNDESHDVVTMHNNASHVAHSSTVAVTAPYYPHSVSKDNKIDVPWNENYDIESDGEFEDDQILFNLRKHRDRNLKKMKRLVSQLNQDPQTHSILYSK